MIDDTIREAREVVAELDKFYREEEFFWFMRFRVGEIKDGDKNILFIFIIK